MKQETRVVQLNKIDPAFVKVRQDQTHFGSGNEMTGYSLHVRAITAGSERLVSD